MKIVIAGDMCPKERVAALIEENSFSQIFEEVQHYTEQADFSIVNLECPIIESGFKPIIKQGPNLGCSRKVVEALSYAGFDCVTLANNHFRDYGDEGCINTIRRLRMAGLDCVGAGTNLTESYKILYKQLEGKNIAVLNFCEHEFSVATENTVGSTPLNLITVYHHICEARKKADIVIVIVHGGHEHYQLPSPRMKEVYRWFVDLGADVVVNHHQHCYSGYEVYNGKPVFYGLGNFCFDWPERSTKLWTEGYMVELAFVDGGIQFQLLPYSQCGKTPSVTFLDGDDKEAFFTHIKKLNEIINDDRKLSMKFDEWITKRANVIDTMLTPYSNRWLLAFWRRGLLPKFMNMRRCLLFLNHVECEAHRDVFIQYLKNKIYA